MCWKLSTKSPKYWEKFSQKGHRIYDIYKTFWKKPLKMEQIDEDSDSFNVLMIHPRLLQDTKGRLIVRQEYLNALVRLEDQYALYPRSGAVVLGHPGIGKSWFLYFLLVLRLSKGQKTIICLKSTSDSIFLFNEKGCYNFKGTTTTHLTMSSLATDAWALVGSSNPFLPPNHVLASEHAPVFTVIPSFPDRIRFNHLQNRNNAIIHVMENWSFNEIWAGAMLRRQPREGEQDRLRDYYWKYGPPAQVLFRLYDHIASPMQRDSIIDNAFESIDLKKLEHLLNVATGATASFRWQEQEMSHSIILVYPHSERKNKIQGQIISYYVFQYLADTLFVRDFKNIVKTYQLFHGIDPFGVSASWTFKYYCHRMLSEHEGRQISLIPLTTATDSKQEGIPFTLYRPDEIKPRSLFTITRRHLHHFSDEFESSVDDQSMLAFQMTTEKENNVNTSINDPRLHVGNRPLTFVLLVPKEMEGDGITLMMSEEVWPEARFFMSAVEVVSPTF